jgi:hypothetical protein
MDMFVFVLEDEPKFQSQIFGALKIVNPAAKIRFFNTLEEFSGWITSFIKDGMAVVETAGFKLAEDTEQESISTEKSVRLLVCKTEILGAQSISLISKTIELFVRKNLCTQEEKTSVVATAFDNPDFDIKPYEVKFFNNVIFKPFDPLILEEHLRYAFVGHKKPNDVNFKSNKLEAQVEMVKDIPCEGFSDLGFITISDREIKIGEVGKFYSDEFASESIRSVMARSVKSVPRTVNGQQTFMCWMEYFGLETGQIKKFRKDLINDYPTTHLNANVKNFKKNILMLDALAEVELPSSLKRFFPQANTYYYSDFNRFVFDSAPDSSGLLVEKDIPVPTGFVLTLDNSGHFFLDQEPKSEIENVFGETFKDLKKKDFPAMLMNESKKAWTDAFTAKKVPAGKDTVLMLENVGKVFLVKLKQITKALNANQMPIWEIGLAEMTMAEKVAYIKSRSPLPPTIDIVIASEGFMSHIVDGQLYPDAKKILIVKNQISDKEKKRWSASVYDVFTVPADRNYLVKKLYLAFMDKGAWTVLHFNDVKKEIQSAQQVQIDEISEAGVSFKYHRPMEVGTFRRFYLWTPNELELRDYHASCNYYEEFKEGQKVTYNHHFVFFGMKDFYLKNIRLWVLENYIQSKSKEGG